MPSNTIIAIIALTIITITAILKGLDSYLLTSAITGIAGLAGYEIGTTSTPK